MRTRPLHVVALVPSAEVVRQLRRETPRIGLWLDASDQTVEQTVQEILLRAPREAAV